MSKSKVITLSLSAIIVLALTVITIFSSLFQTQTIQLPTRSIDTAQIGTLSYNEQIDAILSEFDVYSYDYNENEVTFNASMMKDLSYFTGIQELNTIDNSKITKSFSTRLDCKTQEFFLVTTLEQNGTILQRTEESVIPMYDEEKNDYYIILDDNSKISIAETLNLDNLNYCIALVDDAAILLAAAAAVTIVVAAPVIVNVVTTVVTTVVTWVKSFWSWFRSLWKPKTKTVTTTTTTQVATPALTIDKTTYKTKSVTRSEVDRDFKNSNYYLCFADPTNGKVYMSISKISEVTAIAILNAPISVPCIGNTNKTMLASTYTFYESNAQYIAQIVGLNPRTPAGRPETHANGRSNFYWHYHTIALTADGHAPHSFFGLPS